MAYATVTDVETRLGRPASSAAETAQWQAWLDDVEALIRDGFRAAGLDLEDAIAAGFPSEETVVRIECDAVIRRINNPDPTLTSVTRSIDDGSVTTRREGGPVDPFGLTDLEWWQLIPGHGGAFSTSPGFEPDSFTTVPYWACP